MATKTVVCPECQSPAAPGRYACSECGALLASVAMPVRVEKRERRGSSRAGRAASAARADSAAAGIAADGPAPDPAVSVLADDPVAAVEPPAPGIPVSPAWTQSLAVEPADTPPTDDERWDDEPPIDRTVEIAGAPLAQAAVTAASEATGPGLAVESDPEHRSTRLADPPELAALAPLTADQGPAGTTVAAPPPPQQVPAWPPQGAGEMFTEPIRRTPAGAYLPPSAVLPSGEALSAAGSGAVAAAASTAPSAAPAAGSTGTSAAARLEQLGLAGDTPRRVVGLGAVIAGLGFLLPWADILAGSGLLGDYWTQWGLAGPGHWIVVALLVALAAISLVQGPIERVPVGLAAIAIAALLVGLCWPYLFGFLGRSVGIWVVLAGAILLGAGGLLDLRKDRHAGPDAIV